MVKKGMLKMNKAINISPKGESRERYRKEHFTKEEIAENDLIVDIVEEMIQARKKDNISQRDLENISGIKQSVIGRMESGKTDPKLSTVIKLLNAMGKTLAIVPIDKAKKQVI